METWGSSPRPAGSHLVIRLGDFLGSVSGGGRGRGGYPGAGGAPGGSRHVPEFGVADETAWRAGLSCRGRIKSYVRPLDPSLLAAIIVERAARRPCAVVANLGSGAERLVRLRDIAADPLAAKLEQRLRQRESGVEESDGALEFVTVYSPPIRLIAIGSSVFRKVFRRWLCSPDLRRSSSTRARLSRRSPLSRRPLVAEWPQDALSARTRPGDGGRAAHPRAAIDDEALIAALNETASTSARSAPERLMCGGSNACARLALARPLDGFTQPADSRSERKARRKSPLPFSAKSLRQCIIPRRRSQSERHEIWSRAVRKGRARCSPMRSKGPDWP